MITSPNKNAAAGLSLGSKLDFFTIETTVDLVSGSAAAQSALNVLIETISTNGQPVISALSSGAASASSGLSGTTSTLKFAVEHTGAWSTATLLTAIEAISVAEQVETENSSGALTGTTLNPAANVVSPFTGSNTVVTQNTL
jgi:hypothetical protein